MAHLESLIEDIYRSQSRKVLATLIRLLGDFDRAEEALQDAFAAAAQRWTIDNIPANPFAWLVSAGRYRAIDHLRRRARFDTSLADITDSLYPGTEVGEMELIEDDMLRLIFTCCHPVIPVDAQVAMALREVCGLTTEEIARAFLVTTPTIAQRIVRAKNRIRTAGIPYEVPDKTALPEGLRQVLHVIYLVFNEGYSASSGPAVIRTDLSAEAIRLGRLIAGLLPDSEANGLLALMLLQDSRRLARVDPSGHLVLLGDQDRARWDRGEIIEGLALVDAIDESGKAGHFALQAAIAAEHGRSEHAAATDWRRIAFLYDRLLEVQPSPVVELNRAVAVSMCYGPLVGLSAIDAVLCRSELSEYHLAHAARADLLRQLRRTDEARQAYETALSLCRQGPEQAFLRKRLTELSGVAR
jgi:RNA polymerase sigma-70 factor (ECF subfamily)